MSYLANPFEPEAPLMTSNDFHFQSSQIRQRLGDYSTCLKNLESAQDSTLTSVGANDQQYQQRQLNNSIAQIKSLQLEIKSSIESLKKLPNLSEEKVSQINNFNRQFKNQIAKFMRIEDKYREKLTQQGIQQYKIINPDVSEYDAREFVENFGNKQVFSNAIRNSNKLQDSTTVLQNVEVRYQQVQQIERLAKELNELTENLQDIVFQQEYQFQQIEENVHVAQTEVEKGDANVIGATTYAKKSRKKKWILFWICLIIVIAILIGITIGILKAVGVMK